MYKKIFLILLTVVFLFSISGVVYGQGDILYGDLNKDGDINSIDASILSCHVLNVKPYEDTNIADLDGDGFVDSIDYVFLSRYILHIIDKFPVEAIPPMDGEIILGDTIEYSGKGISVEDSIVTITAGGRYKVKGTLEDGMIKVDTTGDVELELINANITNSNGPAIYIANANKADIVTKTAFNSLTDGSVSIYDTEEEKVEGALVSNAPLSICGPGILSVTGNYDQGIISYSKLCIEGTRVNIVSNAADGIHSKESIEIISSDIKIHAASDGIHSKEGIEIIDSDIEIDVASDGIDSKAGIYIQKGRLNIKAAKHGITSKGEIELDDVIELVLNTGRDGFNTGGSVLIKDSRIFIEANEEGFDVDGDVTLLDSEDRISLLEITSIGDAFDVSGKMILNKGAFYITSTENDIFDADGGIEIKESILRFDAGKHGLTTESDISILDGDIEIVSKRDGLNADGDVIIVKNEASIGVGRSGKIKIEAGEEGFDIGGSLTLEAGEIDITSFGDVFSVSGDIIIEKGSFNLKSTSGEDDGIDSDGSITINGGTFVIDAGKDAITADLDITIEGGHFSINSGSDAFDAGECVLIENGNFEISSGNDGIKGSYVVINGGEIDAISVAETIDGKNSIKINGGNIKLLSEESSAIYAKELAEVTISGGNITAIGADNSDDEKLAAGILCDPNTFTITGGTLIATGEMNSSPNPELSTQCTVLLGGAEEGSVISITSNGEEILSFTAPKKYQSMLLITSPELVLDGEYELNIDGENVLSFKITSMVTNTVETTDVKIAFYR
jgi:hypothetical protein